MELQIPELEEVKKGLADIKELISNGNRQAAEAVKYARCSTLAKMFDMTPRNMSYILARGCDVISKIGGQRQDGTRGAVTLYKVADVESYMIISQGGNAK